MENQPEIRRPQRYVEAFRNSGHSLPESIADLVDNSIDAGARNIMVRFVRTQSSLQQLQVIDDGQGMTEAQAVDAVRFGRTDYDDTSVTLGMGLPVATASSAGGLTVISKTRKHGTIGLHWNLEEGSDAMVVERFDPEWAESHMPMLDSGLGTLSDSPGTVIQWDRVHDFSRAADRGVDKYLERSFREIRLHLGLHFHRFIERGRVNISICSFDVDTGRNELTSEVGALDPFGYPEPGRSGYPRPFLLIDKEHGDLELTAHIWPRNSKLDQYRLDGTANRQGLYFYRNDRLLHGGGWCGLRADAQPHLSLARVAIDLPMSWQSVIKSNFAGPGVSVPGHFTEALHAARSVSGDLSFDTFIKDAELAYRDKGQQAPTVETADTPEPDIPDGDPLPGMGVAALTGIELWNFKSVQMARVGLRPLTVLVGKNSSGKSSLIESILMRSQAGRDNHPTEVPLNGDLVRLGTFTDILNNTFGDVLTDTEADPYRAEWMMGEDCQGFRVGGEVFISRHGLLGRTSRRRRTRRDRRITSHEDRQTIGAFDPLGDDHTEPQHLYPGPDSLSALRAPAVRRSLDKLLQQLADHRAGSLRAPDDEGLTLRWRMEVTASENPGESYGTARGGLIQLLDRDEVLFSVDTRFDSFNEAPEQLEHIGADEQSEWFEKDKPAILGEATHPDLAEDEARIVEVQPLNGLPAAIRYSIDAKMLIARNLVSYWANDVSMATITEGLEPGTGRSTTAGWLRRGQPLPHRITFRRLLRVLESLGMGYGEEGDPDDYLEACELVRTAFEENRLLPDQIRQLEELPDWSWDWDPEVLDRRDAEIKELVHQGAHWVDFYLKMLKKWWPRMEEAEEIYGFSQDSRDYFSDSKIVPTDSIASARIVAPGMAQDISDMNSGDEGVARAVRKGGPPRMETSHALLRRIRFLSQDERSDLLNRVVAATTEKTKFTGVVADPAINSLLRALSQVAHHFICDRTYFVGPLREAPRPHYEALPQKGTRHVGQRGEYTAALLAQLGGSPVWCPGEFEGQENIMRLDEALRFWLGPENLGLVTRVQSTPIGGAGYRLEVQPLGMERLVPISAVGMGVSQILPVLVQGLLAPQTDCLLLLQQPELHLHPALQEGLADFLLALAMSGRRVIVETHSEYLVSRLAHNLVDLDWELDSPERYIGLVLVSQKIEDGTTYRATEIDPLGTINWPEGFFNESTTTALATLKAGLAKLERSESPDTPTGG
jgi:hypothetical protein